MNRYSHYDNAANQYQLSKAQVSALVKKHNLRKRKIYGRMAVDSDAWRQLMNELGIPMAPGYKLVGD